MDPIRREIVVPASLERTWRLVTHPAAVAEWFPGSHLDVRVGGAATFACGPGEVFHGVVERVEPPHRLVWRWSHVAGRAVNEGPTTRVHLLLEAVADGTRVQLVESGFGALGPGERARCRRLNGAEWDRLLPCLARLADGAPPAAALVC